MNNLRRILTALAIALFLAAPLSAARAQGTPKAPVIAVFDSRVILRDSIVGKAWQEYYNAKRKGHKDSIATEEKKLRTAWDELNRQRSILAPQAFQVRERAFRDMESAAKNRIGQMDQELGRSLRATLGEVQKRMDAKLGPIVDQIVEERSIELILPAQGVALLVRKDLDITPEVLKRFNKALPKLDIPALAAKAKP
jgi:Skp family chaperone for outer membrane proteins